MLYRLLAAQCVVSAVVAVLFALGGGLDFGISAALGAAVYLVPSALAVGVWQVVGKNIPLLFPVVFFIAESIKISLALLAMAAVFVLYPAVQWQPFLLSLIAVCCSVFFVIGKISLNGNHSTS